MAEGDVELGPVDMIDHTVQLLLNFDEEEMDRSKQHPRSIFMVPSVYRDLSPHSFTPRVVSIGPLHHEDKHLKGFEVQKATYMHHLFNKVLRSLRSTPEQIMKACVTKVSSKIEQIKACYIGMQPYPDSELVKMMVTDACFILAFKYNTPSLGINWSLTEQITLDMVQIENQIPFFVLQDIFDCTISKLLPEVPLPHFIYGIPEYFKLFEGHLAMDNSSNSSAYDHILGFVHKCYQNPDHDSSSLFKRLKAHSAVELDRSGVRFSNKIVAKWPMAIELKHSRFRRWFPLSWSKLTLKMPTLRLYDMTESVLRNLIIYEQSARIPTCVTSYLKVMDMLIDTPEDVAKLVKSQVLDHHLGSDEKVANLINSMLKEVVIRDFYYEDEWKQMDDHYNSRWPKFIADLKRNYFRNPWSIIALFAGIVLFVLTVVQTVYGVKAV